MTLSCNHILKALFQQMKDKKIHISTLEQQVGLGQNVVRRWQRRSEPLLGNAIAALNAVGLDLVVTRMENTGPQMELNFNNDVKEKNDGTFGSTEKAPRL